MNTPQWDRVEAASWELAGIVRAMAGRKVESLHITREEALGIVIALDRGCSDGLLPLREMCIRMLLDDRMPEGVMVGQ